MSNAYTAALGRKGGCEEVAHGLCSAAFFGVKQNYSVKTLQQRYSSRYPRVFVSYMLGCTRWAKMHGGTARIPALPFMTARLLANNRPQAICFNAQVCKVAEHVQATSNEPHNRPCVICLLSSGSLHRYEYEHLGRITCASFYPFIVQVKRRLLCIRKPYP